MRPTKKYHEWKRIFLDTCTIIEYTNAVDGFINDQRALFTKKIIDDLTSQKEKTKSPTIIISAISISEMVLLTSDNDLKHKILAAFNASNVEIVSWNRQTAIHSNIFCKGFLSKKEMNRIADQTSLSIENKKFAREYLIKDYMLITSADFYDCDVILTADVKTFIPIADKLGFPAISMEEDSFNFNEKYIFGLNDSIDA